MELITKALIQELKIPELYGTENEPVDEKLMLLKYLEPNTGWFWYLCEYDEIDKRAFGYVIGHEREWGYFSLEEMESIYTIVRDEAFEPIKFKDLKNL